MARKILLADDSVTAQNMGRRILSEAGYDVLTVNNGSAALKKIAEIKPDIVILDVYMPGYGGLEVCQRVKDDAETAHIPVLLTVGKLEPFKADEARRVHADAHLVKPFEASELLTALAKLEDKIVPQAPAGFEKPPVAVERPQAPAKEVKSETPTPSKDTKFGDSTTGWKNRLKIPLLGSKRAAPEKAPAPSTAFRNFEHTAEPAPPESQAPAYSGPVLGTIPGDITPEEIAAIASIAAEFNHVAEPDAPVVVPEPVASEEDEVPATFASSPQAWEEAAPEQRTAEEVTAERIASEPIAAEYFAEQAFAEQAVAEPTSPQENALPEVAYQPEIEPPSGHEIAAASEITITSANPYMALGAAIEAEHLPEAEPEPEPQTEPEIATAIAPPPAHRLEEVEVAAALESLGPLNGDGFGAPSWQSTSPANGNAVHTPQEISAASELAAQSAATGPRWIAEEVPVPQDEAALILEQEMQKAYAAMKEGYLSETRGVSTLLETTYSTLAANSVESAPEPATAFAPEPAAIGSFAGDDAFMASASSSAEEATDVVGAESSPMVDAVSELAPVEAAVDGYAEPASTASSFSESAPSEAGDFLSTESVAPAEMATPVETAADDYAEPEIIASGQNEVRDFVSAESSVEMVTESAPVAQSEPAHEEVAEIRAEEATTATFVEPAATPEPEPVVAVGDMEIAATTEAPVVEIAAPQVTEAVSEAAVGETPAEFQVEHQLEPQAETIFAAAAAASAAAGTGFRSISHVEELSATAAPAEFTESAPAAVPAADVPHEREAELAAAWAHWKQIRESIGGPQLASHLAEAAAASAEFKVIQKSEPASTAASPAAADTSTIASIVESVLAELRPKLVEEIAKKLGGKK